MSIPMSFCEKHLLLALGKQLAADLMLAPSLRGRRHSVGPISGGHARASKCTLPAGQLAPMRLACPCDVDSLRVSALVKRLPQYPVRIEAVGIDQGEAGALDR